MSIGATMAYAPSHSTIKTGQRSLAIAAGMSFTAGALYILLEDIAAGHHWSMEHVLTVFTVVGTIAVGHLAVEAARIRHRLPALGFCLLFVAGTALTVYNSVGRQAESSDARLLDVEARNEQIVATKRALSANTAMLTEARERHARECATGRGKRCDGIAATIRVYEDAVKGNNSDLFKLGPPKPVAPKAEKMAAVAAVFGADKTRAKALLMLIEPFAYTLFFELGSIISLGYGLGGQRLPERSATRLSALAKHRPRNRRNVGNGWQVSTISKDRAEQDLIARLATGATVASQEDLAATWNVNKGTVSKWVSEWERNGKIPARQQAGRRKMIART
ncbi:hypothetical protein [Hyphomicrobium sp. LHD-15]|uniref:hypothetical protein n=1 Tax=Hyphomicrobium sp. LHD-15 TaxID=3072142 RepID=UPI00280DADA0|nr:hypothetical protein [Hyphomicrobium sp. LHD-15]MDQ8699204.1 hypothetical protein [Hyphomicrobium sp. LHD-15]